MSLPPKALTLDWFTVSRPMWVGIPQWRQVTDWQRVGLVSIKPTHPDQATVTLTDAGRLKLSEGEAAT